MRILLAAVNTPLPGEIPSLHTEHIASVRERALVPFQFQSFDSIRILSLGGIILSASATGVLLLLSCLHQSGALHWRRHHTSMAIDGWWLWLMWTSSLDPRGAVFGRWATAAAAASVASQTPKQRATAMVMLNTILLHNTPQLLPFQASACRQ